MMKAFSSSSPCSLRPSQNLGLHLNWLLDLSIVLISSCCPWVPAVPRIVSSWKDLLPALQVFGTANPLSITDSNFLLNRQAKTSQLSPTDQKMLVLKWSALEVNQQYHWDRCLVENFCFRGWVYTLCSWRLDILLFICFNFDLHFCALCRFF